MTSKRRQRRAPAGLRVCVDEHIHADVAQVFRRHFPTIHAAKSSEFAGRDERDYLPVLFQRNIIFVTSDTEFVTYVSEENPQHAGMVYLPPGMTDDEKVLFAEYAAFWIEGSTSTNRHNFRGVVLYPALDGIRYFVRKGSHDKRKFQTWLGASWDSLTG